MRTKMIAQVLAATAIGLIISGCDLLGIGGNQPTPPPPLPVLAPPAPAMPQAIPPAQPIIPGQPVPAAPAIPAPVAAPIPVVPTPMAPIAAPVPVAPIAAPVPVAPVAAPIAAPVPVAPVAAPIAVPVPTGDIITDKMNVAVATYAADKTPTSTLVKATLNAGKDNSFNVSLPGPPFCHTFIAVGSDTVKNIDVSLTSPAGTVDTADATEENTAVTAHYCPATAGVYTLKVKMATGSGEFGVQVFSK